MRFFSSFNFFSSAAVCSKIQFSNEKFNLNNMLNKMVYFLRYFFLQVLPVLVACLNVYKIILNYISLVKKKIFILVLIVL